MNQFKVNMKGQTLSVGPLNENKILDLDLKSNSPPTELFFNFIARWCHSTESSAFDSCLELLLTERPFC